MTDNPFQQPDPVPGGEGANEAGALPPVALEVVPILERCTQILTSRVGVMVVAVFVPLVFALLGGFGAGVIQFLEAAAHDESERSAYELARFAVQTVNQIVAIFFSVGQARIYSRLVRGLDADPGMLFAEVARFPAALVLTILLVVVTSLGTLACVVPGIVAFLGLQFGILALVDQDLGPIDALQESWRLASNRLLEIFLIDLALFVLALVLSCVTLGIGYFVVIPIFVLAQAVMYHTLLHEAGPR